MYLLLVILMVIASILMCFIVLIQNSKGGGLASGFSSSNQIMGVRKTTDFLEKATWSLAVFLVVMSVASAYVIPSASHKGGDVDFGTGTARREDEPYNMPVGTAAPKAEQPARSSYLQPTAPAGYGCCRTGWKLILRNNCNFLTGGVVQFMLYNSACFYL